MDVNKPSSVMARLATTAVTAEVLQPVALEKLALLPAQSYEARVLAKASAEVLRTLSANQQALPGNAKPAEGSASNSPDALWLLRIQGKTLLVELPVPARAGNTPNITLQPGDRLWIQLRSDGSLAFRPATQRDPAATLSSLSTASLTQLLELPKAQLELYLAKALHQQLPTPNVLLQLQPAQPSTLTSGQQDLLQEITTTLRKQMPTKALFDALNTPVRHDSGTTGLASTAVSPADAAQLLKLYLDKQGLAFEHKLMRALVTAQAPPDIPTPASPSSGKTPAETQFSARQDKNLNPLTALIQRLHPGGTIPVADAASVKIPLAVTTVAPGTASVDIIQHLNVRSAQALATALHQANHQTATPDAAPGKSAEALPLVTNLTHNPHLTLSTNLTHSTRLDQDSDLKSTLLGLIRDIARRSDTEASAPGKPSAASLSNDNLQLLANPLAFPRPMLPMSILKANAMLADQELTTGQILRLLAGMLHRIQFNQLNSLHQTASNSTDTVTTQSWMFDLPVANGTQNLDFFQLRLDRDKKQAAQNEHEQHTRIQWKISLSFNFEQLGLINIHLKLIPPAATSIIWATQPDTLKLIQKHGEHLRERLSLLGLNLDEIQYQDGAPAAEVRPIQASIVDIRA